MSDPKPFCVSLFPARSTPASPLSLQVRELTAGAGKRVRIYPNELRTFKWAEFVNLAWGRRSQLIPIERGTFEVRPQTMGRRELLNAGLQKKT